jgi:hypothetical protein
MSELPTTIAGAEAADPPPGVTASLCPGCGYDLRAATSDRCSECGLVIDRAALRESGFPWAHRRRIGRLRAILKTVWLVTIDGRALRDELAKPQDARDAASFRAVNTTVLALSLLILAGILAMGWGLQPVAIEPVRFAYGNGGNLLPG